MPRLEELLNTIHQLEDESKIDEQNYLPTPVQNIRDLETDIKTLSALWHKLSFVINTLTHLNATLETIREDINKSKKPISLFFKSPPVLVSISTKANRNSAEQAQQKPQLALRQSAR